MLFDLAQFRTLADGLDHPECVTAAIDGTPYAGGEAGQVYRVNADGSHIEIGSTGGFTLGLCLDADANVYTCDMVRRAVMRVDPVGVVSTYSTGSSDRPIKTPNYPVFDADGNLYVSDSGDWKQSNGCLFVVRPDGTTSVLREDVANFPNGLAIDPAGSHLYVVETNANRIVRVAIETDGRSSGPVEQVVVLPARHVPDGIIFDEGGRLYIGCYAPDVIYRVAPDGTLEMVCEDWERTVLAAPANLAFVGPERRTLAVSSLGRWHLAGIDLGVAGAPLRYPHLPK
jgi:gluconolactonase